MVPSIAVIPREGSFALAFFGSTRKVQDSAFPVSAGRKSLALKRTLEVILVICFVSLMANGRSRRRSHRLANCMSLRNSARANASAISYRGSSGTGGGWHFDWRRLGLVGDQFAQERNQHGERDTDRKAAGAKLREELRVPGVGGDRRGDGRHGDHYRKVTCKERREAGHEHPAAHHH